MRTRPAMGRGRVKGPELGLSKGRLATLGLAPSASPRRI